MRATELLKALADLIAQHGDLEVFLKCGEGSGYSRLHANDVSVSPVHRVPGKSAQWVDGITAKGLGYELTQQDHGILLR